MIYVPELSYNLLSVSKMTEVGKKVRFYDSRCQVFDKNKSVVAIATKKGNTIGVAVSPTTVIISMWLEETASNRMKASDIEDLDILERKVCRG